MLPTWCCCIVGLSEAEHRHGRVNPAQGARGIEAVLRQDPWGVWVIVSRRHVVVQEKQFRRGAASSLHHEGAGRGPKLAHALSPATA